MTLCSRRFPQAIRSRSPRRAVNYRGYPRLSTKRGALTAASKSLAMVPRGSSVTWGMSWNALRTFDYVISLAPFLEN